MSLLGPFLLKLKRSRLEIYPAVILPAGSGTLNMDRNTFSINTSEVYVKKGDEWIEIEKEDFLHPIPSHFYSAIKQGNFGLKKYSYQLQIAKIPFIFKTENNHNSEAKDETAKWYKERLSNNGFKDSFFIIRDYKILFNLDSRKLQSKDLINEEVIRLY